MSLTVIRQAKLRPECAGRYPTLPARMWTSAACLAGLVASCGRGVPDGTDTLGRQRTLPETDFEFRGGFNLPAVTPDRSPEGLEIR